MLLTTQPVWQDVVGKPANITSWQKAISHDAPVTFNDREQTLGMFSALNARQSQHLGQEPSAANQSAVDRHPVAWGFFLGFSSGVSMAWLAGVAISALAAPSRNKRS
ncbi:MAG: hypothetical protein Q8O94_02710 [bacterium]|nr:hypothetical protein [bacterium]